MSSRGRRSRGRPSKTQSLSTTSTRSHFLKKPKAYQQASDDSSRCSTPQSGIHSSQSSQRSSTRTRTRQAAQKSRSFMHHHIFDNDDDLDNSSLPDKDSSFSDSDANSDAGGNATDWSESSLSTISSTPLNRSKFYPRRPKSPDYIDPKDIPPLILPPSSTDLFLPSEYLLKVLSIYEVLRHFWRILRISPFRFEDFCAALVADEMSTLLSEVHITLLRALLRAEDANNTIFGPSDIKDSINVSLFFLDSVTWYESVRAYLDSDRAAEFQASKPAFNKPDYCSTTLVDRIQILETLTDLFLTTNPVREEIMNEGNIKYDDHCRNCHRRTYLDIFCLPLWMASRLGDLLCCETCSAVYHLQCVDPPMEEVPEEDWVCAVCEAHKVKGVSDCRSEAERHGILCRQDPLGMDRHMRRYYLICRRIVVEGDDEVWYYSSKPQLEELLEVLDDDKWESDLVRMLLDAKKDLERYMCVTEELTNEHKGSKKTALELEVASLQKYQSSRAERRAKELEEQRRQEQQERERREEQELARLEAEERAQDEVQRALEAGVETSKETCDLTPEEMMAVSSSTTVTTTSSEVVVMSENMESGLVATTEEVETSTTTVTKTITSTIAKADNVEIGSGDAGKDVTETEEKTEKESESPPTTIQSALPNVRTAVLTPDGKVMTTSGQSLLNRTTKTVMVVGKDGKKTVMRVVSQPEKAEDGSIVTTSSSSDQLITEDNRLIVTRSKTGSLVPKQFLDSVTSTSAKTSMSKTAMEDSILVINKDGELTRTTRSKTEVSTTNTSMVLTTQISYFRLGIEGSFKSYTNQFSSNPLALNKHQHNEERDKRRHLSHKFSLTPASEFKWNGTTHGARSMIVSTLRLSIAQLENNIPTPFLHPNWPIHRKNWVKAVHMCAKPEDFALALTILEASIKPVLMNPVWSDALGHTRLQRVTALEKEEIKKREKEQRKVKPDEEEYFRTTWSKYTLGLKHQVFKQKGEEYRIAGTGGWLWLRSSRVYQYVPQDTVGLRGVARKLKAKKMKAAESTEIKEEEAMDTSEKLTNGEASDDTKEGIKEETKEEEIKEEGVKEETKMEDDKEDDNKVDVKEENKEKDVENTDEKSEDTKKENDYEDEDGVIDVSRGLLQRSRYVKTTKPYSKLDLLLEKRLRQQDIEMKQKALFEQIVMRYRKQEAEKKRLLNEREQALQKEKEEVMEVDFKEERAKRDAGKSSYVCYSASCRCRGEFSKCYSVTCTAASKEDGLESDEEDENEDNEIDVTDNDKKENGEKDEEEEDIDVDVVGDKEEGSQASKLKKNKSVPKTPQPKPAESKPSTSSTASLVNAPQSGIISLQSLAKGGKIQLTPQLVSDIEARLSLVGKTRLKVSLNKHARLRGKGKLAMRKGNLPPGHKFMTKSKKRNLFILERSAARKLARGAGHRETQGFNYNCKMNNVGWPYPCPRPSFKTTWRYRTQCISNLPSAGIQLRILWAALRWDDMNAKPPASGNNTNTTDTEITTTELLKRRDTGAYGLRSEFLIRKIVVPIGVPQQPREKYTPQRSGLRERKRAEEPRQTEPSLSEAWMPEETLDLWEIKVFGDKVEKQRAALQEKLAQQQQAQKEQSAAKLKADLEDQLKAQRLAMQQKRLEQGKKDDTKTYATTTADGKPAQSILQQKFTTITKTPSSGIRVITSSVPGSNPSLVKVTPIRSTATPRVITTPVNKVALQPKTLLSAALVSGGKIQLPSTAVQLRPKTVLTTAGAAAPTVVSTPAGLKPIAPSTTQATPTKGTQLQIKPQISGSSSPAAAAAAVQNLRIIQGANGQLQVQGLLPGQQLVKLPDGRLQLITSSATSAALQQKQSPTTPAQATVQTPKVEVAKPQIQVTTTATSQPGLVKVQLQKPAPAPAPTVVAAKPEPHVIVTGPGQEKTVMQVAKTPTVAALTQIAQPQVVQTGVTQPRVVVQGGVVTPQALAQAQQLVQQQQQQQQAQQQIVQQKILPQTVQIKGQTLQLGQTGQLASVGGTLWSTSDGQQMVTTGQQAVQIANPATPAATVIKTTPIAPKVITAQTALAASPAKPQVVSAAGVTTSGSSVAALLAQPKVVISSPQTVATTTAAPTVTSPSGVKPVTPVLQQLQQQLQQHRLQLAGNKVLLSSANKAALTTGQPTLVKLPNGQQFLIRAPMTQTAAAAALASLNNSVASGTSTTTTTAAIPAVTSPAVTATLSPPPQPAVAPAPAQVAVKRTLVSPQPPQPQAQRSLLPNPKLASPPMSPPAEQGKFDLTDSVVQQVVKQALMQNQDPEIQAKLTAMHKSMQQQQTNDTVVVHSNSTTREIVTPEVVPKTKVKIPDDKKKDMVRLHVCSLVMKGMLDKIERDEKREMKDATKKARKQESAEEKAQKLQSAKLYGLLYKQKDNLQREMLKKRSILERSMQSDIRAEVNDAMRRTKRAIKRKQYKDAWEEDKKSKKQKVITSGGATGTGGHATPKKRPQFKPNKLYCICKTLYDETKFYVGCDLCSNWFHGACVNINETDAQYVDTYVCKDCRSQQENSSEELYCVCKTAYDESQFYIGCDRCQDWFHGTCVGVSKSEADKMDTYVCPKCQKNGTDDATMNSKILTLQNLQDLKGLLKNLLMHKMSWPFREPVDRRKVPDYYKIIKEPMDLSLIARKLENAQYKRLGDFVKDVMKIFDNCRYYNASDSPFYQCAEVLEPHFVQNLKVIKEKL